MSLHNVNAGEVVGASSFSVAHGPSILKKVASLRMLHQVSDVENFGCYPLRRRVSCTAASFILVLFCFCNFGNFIVTILHLSVLISI